MTWPAPDRSERLATTIISDPESRHYAYLGNCGTVQIGWSCCGPTLRVRTINGQACVLSLSNEETDALIVALQRETLTLLATVDKMEQ
jgi:hypothetical protein